MDRYIRDNMMSIHVFSKVKMRAVEAGRFGREFGKEYGDRIENACKKWNRSIFVY